LRGFGNGETRLKAIEGRKEGERMIICIHKKKKGGGDYIGT